MTFYKRKWFWMPLVGIALLAIVYSFFDRGDGDIETLSFSEVVAAAQDGRLEKIEVSRRNLEVTLEGDDTRYESRVGGSTDVVQVLIAADVPLGGGATQGVEVEYAPPSSYGNIVGLLISCLPLIVYPFVLYWVFLAALRKDRREQRGDHDGAELAEST